MPFPDVLVIIAIIVAIVSLYSAVRWYKRWQYMRAVCRDLETLFSSFSITHRHQCPKCSFVWEHDSETTGRTPGHQCPSCGTAQYVKYFGEEPATEVDPEEWRRLRA